MKTKVLFSVLFATGVLFSSCSKDDDPTPLTKDQAKVEIANLTETYATDSIAIINNEGMKAYDALSNLALPFVLPVTDLGGSVLSKVIARPDMDLVKKRDFRAVQQRLISLSGFVFSEYVGTWEQVNQVWTRTSTTPTDKVVVKFPYPSTNATNNAIYTISKYTIVASDMGYSGQYNANLSISGSEVWSVALTGSSSSSSISGTSTVVYTSIATPKVSYEQYESMELKISGNQVSGSVSFKASRSLKKNGSILLAANFTTTVSGSDTGVKIAMSGNVTIANIRFEFKLAYSGTSLSEDVVMDKMQINVYNTAGAKLGSIELSKDLTGNTVATFVYVNGDKEDAEVLFGKIFYKIQGLFEGLAYIDEV